MKLQDKLYNLRKKNGYTQAELAEILGVSRQSVSSWELGAIQPSTSRLKKISELYSVPLETLLDEGIEIQRHPEHTEVEERENIQENIEDKNIVLSQEEKNRRERQRKKVVIAALIGIILIILAVVLGYNLAKVNDKKEPVPLEQLKNEEVTISSGNGFDLQ